MIKSYPPFFAKDFIETPEGLIFAVVAHGIEQDKVLSFLRYVHNGKHWQKHATDSANDFLKHHHPKYVHYSEALDAHLHAVCIDDIVKHHQPKQRLRQLLQTKTQDVVEQDLVALCDLLHQQGLDLNNLGITGSVLVGVQKPGSDLDLVCYGRDAFQQCRAITLNLIKLGHVQMLSESDWQNSFERRACALSYEDYVWHEQRKCNKAVINGRKFDLNFIDRSMSSEITRYQKRGPITLQCRVINDDYGFDYPAEFVIDHAHISSVVSFTATYTGQAFLGELIEVVGTLEISAQGQQRIVVGASREAEGEYIRVIRA